MSVKLVAITKPIIEDCEAAEEFIAYCARVSNPSNQANHETAPKLLRYLINNAHWSPLEMASMVVEIITTRDIGRQILRHRSFSFQEFSQRYASCTEYQLKECRLQDVKNRQSSLTNVDEELSQWWIETQEKVAENTKAVYIHALERGLAKEVARSVLPEGLTETKMYMSGTIRSWFHYCELRCQPSTQKEHREIALECRRILNEQFPALGTICS